jgi:tyrosine-protein kinase Etk/Wzc
MTSSSHGSQPVIPPTQEKEESNLGLMDIAIILLERKWFIVGTTFFACVAAIVYVLLATSYYTSTAVILPSKQNFASPIGALMGDMPLGGLLKNFDFLGGEDNSRFISILDSRPLAEQVIQQFDLFHRYGFHKKKKVYKEDILKQYYKNVSNVEDDLGNIRIAVVDSNPEIAAQMANYIAQQMDSLSFELNRKSAKGSRIFFETRLEEMKHTLDSVHHAFADFQTKYNFIDMDTQIKASIEALATLEAASMSASLEKEVLSSSFGNNARLSEVTQKKKAIDKRLADYMENGGGSLVLPLKRTPELGIQYAYLYRDVKVQETLYAFILQMYEQARFKEANNAPQITVLEPAVAAQKRTRPKRQIICLLTFFATAVGTSIWVLIAKFLAEEKRLETDFSRKVRTIKGLLFKWR